MAVIRQRKDKNGTLLDHQYQAIVRMKNRTTGVIYQEAETFDTSREAEEWASGIEADLRRGLHTDTRTIDTTPLHGLIERYIKEVSPSKLGSKQEIVRLARWLYWPKDVRPDEMKLEREVGEAEKCKDQAKVKELNARLSIVKQERKSDPKIFANRPLSKCTPKDFADYIAVRRKAKSKRGGRVAEQTIKLELIAVSNVFEIARKDWGYDLPNPTKQINKPKGSNTREVRIEPQDWVKIAAELRKCRNKQYVIIAEFAIETGMRQDELFRMCWNDVDLLGRKVIVDGKDTSTTGQRKKRTVPLSTRAIELLQSLPRSINGSDPVFQVARKTSADGLSRAFTAACKAIGLAGGCFHSTRHEAASRMAPHYPMLTLMKVFGWKTPTMAARYYHASDEELRAGIERMERAAQSA